METMTMGWWTTLLGVVGLSLAVGYLRRSRTPFLGQNLTKPAHWQGLPFLVTTLAILLLFGLLEQTWLHNPITPIILPGVITLTASWVLAQIFSSPVIRGGFILLLSCFFWSNLDTNGQWMDQPWATTASSLLLGLFLWKAIHHFSPTEENATSASPSWLDILPATLFLTGSMWIPTVYSGDDVALYQGVLLASIVTTLFLEQIRVLLAKPGQPTRWNTILIQGIILAVAAWFAFMALNQLLIQKPNLTLWGCLLSGGILLGTALSALSATSNNDADTGMTIPRTLTMLALVGIGALIASRLFGTVGWLVLAAGAMYTAETFLPALTSWPSVQGALASRFYAIRSLLQVFLYLYNPNVTGINITHPYASAALFAGIALSLLLPALIQRIPEPTGYRWAIAEKLKFPALSLLVLAATGLVLPLVFGYFLHAEPMGSLLVTTSMATLAVLYFWPTLVASPMTEPAASWKASLIQSTLLLPPMMVSVSLLGARALDLGTEADRTERLTALAIVFAALLVTGWLAQRFLLPKSNEAVSVPGH